MLIIMMQVLDLDETLVHSTLDGCDSPDFSFPVSFNNREHRCVAQGGPHLWTCPAPTMRQCHKSKASATPSTQRACMACTEVAGSVGQSTGSA